MNNRGRGQLRSLQPYDVKWPLRTLKWALVVRYVFCRAVCSVSPRDQGTFLSAWRCYPKCDLWKLWAFVCGIWHFLFVCFRLGFYSYRRLYVTSQVVEKAHFGHICYVLLQAIEFDKVQATWPRKNVVPSRGSNQHLLRLIWLDNTQVVHNCTNC